MHRSNFRSAAAGRRAGLSFLEFLGCFCALAGGVVLGSLYLGVDVWGTTTRLFQQQGLIAATSLAPPQPALTVRQNASSVPDPQQTAPQSSPPVLAPSVSQTEPTTTKVATAVPPKAPPRNPSDAAAVPEFQLTPQQRADLTSAYWLSLNDCLQAEVAGRTASLQAKGQWDLYGLLSARSDGHRRTAETISQLSKHGVDARVTEYADKAQAWHEDGATLYERAKELLSGTPAGNLEGPVAQSWQAAATQHQMEERLLAEKHLAVAAFLRHEGQLGAATATQSE